MHIKNRCIIMNFALRNILHMTIPLFKIGTYAYFLDSKYNTYRICVFVFRSIFLFSHIMITSMLTDCVLHFSEWRTGNLHGSPPIHRNRQCICNNYPEWRDPWLVSGCHSKCMGSRRFLGSLLSLVSFNEIFQKALIPRQVKIGYQ